MREILSASEIAKAIGDTPQRVRAGIRDKRWGIGWVEKHGRYVYCKATINEVAKRFDLSREEIIKRIEEG